MWAILDFLQSWQFFLLLGLGFLVGTIAEKRHYASIIRRERELGGRPLSTFGKRAESSRAIADTRFVSGSVVVSIDYFKRILAMLRNIFGGNVRAYESLVDRGRREALLRMQDDAEGMDMIINVRVETSTIGNAANKKGNIGSIEVFAYGTAVTFEKSA